MSEKLIVDKPTITKRPVTGVNEVDSHIESLSKKLSLGMRNDFYQMISSNKPKTISELKNIFKSLIEHHKKQVPRL
ncbi:MAG: hypothetical protein HY096_03870 [Nitrospinae bacterium]|nr:hypothetical protein [Nitrospinota bacterium]